MSRAVERCPSSVRPWALRNVVLLMPMACAMRFMRRAKAASLPDTASPSAVAASLADFTAAARIRWRMAIFWPDFSPSRDGGSAAAVRETVTVVSSEISPRWMAANTT